MDRIYKLQVHIQTFTADYSFEFLMLLKFSDEIFFLNKKYFTTMKWKTHRVLIYLYKTNNF